MKEKGEGIERIPWEQRFAMANSWSREAKLLLSRGDLADTLVEFDIFNNTTSFGLRNKLDCFTQDESFGWWEVDVGWIFIMKAFEK